jgi:branched-chain amino acid transport system ATP-binding protein
MLSIRDLRVGYGKVEALHGISLEVEAGQIVAIIGANGAGKSTLLNTVSGMIPSKGGQVEFEGKPISRRPSRIVEMGIVQVPEGRRIFPSLTIEENLRMGAYVVRQSAAIKASMEKVYSLFPILAQRRGQFGGTLSGGEQQMLAIGRGLMSSPRLLLLDEPSLGLAPLVVRDMFKLFRQINKEGVTILLVEQNARQALAIAEKAYVLETGTIIRSGSGKELLEDPAVKRAYLGA